jgi:hypothetical protein
VNTAGAPSTGGAPMTLEEAAIELARVLCTTWNDCESIALQWEHGSLAECISRNTQRGVWQATLADSGVSVAAFQACASAYQDLSCSERLSNATVVDACAAVHGSRANGSACLDGGQCTSGYCDTPDFTCGVCATAPLLGANCTSSQQCAGGQVCATAGVCVTPQGSLGSCEDDGYCDHGYACVNHICRTRATSVGDLCDPAVGNPWCASGLICDTTNHVCREMRVAQAGETCGWLGNVWRACAYYGTCSSTNKCPAVPAPGSTCSNASGPYCIWPNQCMGGKCVAPPTMAAACGA